MLCFIYKSLKKDQLYLYLGQKDDFSRLPESCLASLGRLEFVMQIELNQNRKLANADINKVIQQLQTKGFYLQMPAEHFQAPAALQ